MSIDVTSDTWKAVAEHCDHEINVQRDRLEGHLSELDTAEARGRIYALRELLGCVDAPPRAPDFI